MAAIRAKDLRNGDVITVDGEAHTVVFARFVRRAAGL